MREKKRKLKKSMSSLLLVKQSEMILPSVLSEASSLVAERETGGERGRKGKKQMETKKNKGLIQMTIESKETQKEDGKGSNDVQNRK